MHKIYHVLRNNKQIGPYTVEELAQLALKPTDLVWVEGKSAGWRYPAEIAALHQLLPSGQQPAPAIKEPAPQNTPLNVKNIYIKLPAVANTNTGEVLPGDKLEQKAEALYQKIQSYTQQKEEQQQQGVPEVNYTRSLNDLKQDYADWLHNTKKRKLQKNLKQKVMVSILFLFVITSGFTITRWMINSNTPLPEQQSKLIAIESAPQQNKTILNASVPLPALSATLIAETKKSADSLSSSTAITTTTKQSFTKKSTKPAVAVAANIVLPIPVPAVVPAPVAEVFEKPIPRAVPLWQLVTATAQYQHDKKGTGISGLTITVHNNSNQTLQKVAVIVSYTKKSGVPFDQQTLYITQLPPQTEAVVKSNSNRKAANAQYKLGVITGQDGTMYIR